MGMFNGPSGTFDLGVLPTLWTLTGTDLHPRRPVLRHRDVPRRSSAAMGRCAAGALDPAGPGSRVLAQRIPAEDGHSHGDRAGLARLCAVDRTTHTTSLTGQQGARGGCVTNGYRQVVAAARHLGPRVSAAVQEHRTGPRCPRSAQGMMTSWPRTLPASRSTDCVGDLGQGVGPFDAKVPRLPWRRASRDDRARSSAPWPGSTSTVARRSVTWRRPSAGGPCRGSTCCRSRRRR